MPVEQKDSEENENDSDVSFPGVPKIEKIHQKVLAAIHDNGNRLEMSTWHTCETTHCRAGWVTFLAGEAGKALEQKTSTLFAAQMIYAKSCPSVKVSPPRFYESNDVAMADIERCAEAEKKLQVKE
jgi:hypothetical protein